MEGGPAGARLGFSVGAVLGGALDARQKHPQSVGRLADLRVSGSAYGVMLPQVWGQGRVAANLIWAPTDLTESSQKKGSKLAGTQTRVYAYSASLMLSFCRGPITKLSRIKAEDDVIWDSGTTPNSTYTIRTYLGTATDAVDTTYATLVGAANAPAYRYQAHAFLENFPLAHWGNRIPNFTAEVINADPAALANDSFNRADQSLTVADSGQTWLFSTTQGNVVSNRATTTGSPGAPTWIECGQADVTVQLTAAVLDGTLGTGHIVFRLVDGSNYWSFGRSGFYSADYEVRKVSGGTTTTIYTTTTTPTAGDVLQVTGNGSTITALVNGVLVATVVDSFNQTATKHGFSAPSTAAIDDWSTVVANPVQSSVKTILADVFGQMGLTAAQYDVSAAVDRVDGFSIQARQPARDALAELLQTYDTYLSEIDGKIVAVKRGSAATVTIPLGNLAARIMTGDEPDPPRTVETRRLSELELPFRCEVSYFSSAPPLLFRQGLQGATRYTKAHVQDPVTVSLPLLLSDTAARQTAEKILYRQWLEREQFTFSLPPSYQYLAPGDVVTIPVAGNNVNVRIIQLDVALPGPVQCTAVLDDAPVLTQAVPGQTLPVVGDAPADVLNTTAVIWSGNALQNADASSVGLYWAANGSSAGFWPGASLYWSRDGGASYDVLDTTTDPSAVGTATTVLSAGTSTGTWDEVNNVTVAITAGVIPTSLSDSAVLSGGNAAIVGDEIIQFGTITPLGGTSYRLSHLLRGRRGTDGHWSEHVTGERFAVLDAGQTRRIALDTTLRQKTIQVKAVTSGQALGAVTASTLLITGDEFKTYAPCQPTGTRDGSNNLTIGFKRRDRMAVGLQDGYDEAMSETQELYDVLIRAGTTKAITGITNAASAVITATAHGYSVNDVLIVTGVVGMTPINGMTATVTAVTTNTLTVNVTTTGFPVYGSGGTLEKAVRTISVTTPSASYTAAQQTTDFGGVQLSVPIAAYQIGRYGRGYGLFATV